MAEIDLGPGFGIVSSHDVEERIRVSRAFSTSLEIERGVSGDVARILLLISMRTDRDIYNSRLKITVNGFSISRVARPVNELQLQGVFHSIFVYDLAPIRDRLRDRVEIDIESRDIEAYVDGVSLIAIYHPAIDTSHIESQNKVYIGPYIIRGGEKISLAVRSYGGDLTIKGIAVPSGRIGVKLSLAMNNTARRLLLSSPTELSLRLYGTLAGGDEEVGIEGHCIDSDCLVKIPWIFIGTSNKKPPEYVIGDIRMLPDRQELLVEFENKGDFEARELNIVALWKGTVVGRAVEKPSRRGIIRVPLAMRAQVHGKPFQDTPLIVRAIWRWMGVLEEREKIFKPGL